MKNNTLKADFKNNLHHSYMILEVSDHSSLEDYQTGMIMNNDIPGLLRLSHACHNKEYKYYYEVTDMEPFSLYVGKWGLNYDLIFQFLKALSVTTNELKAYLLEPDHLIIRPEYIFFDETKESFGFCFHKDHEEKISQSLHQMAEYFTNEKMEDERGGVLVKELYERTGERNFSIDKVLDLAAGKYYAKNNMGFSLKKNLEDICSKINEKEIIPDFKEEAQEKGIKAKLTKLKIRLHHINERILHKEAP